jgi:hypothetical protein
MKIFKVILFAALVVGGLASCSKEDDSAIIGTWEGAWGFDFDDPTVYEKWEIKKGGELVAYNSNGGKMATGFWKVNGFNFEAKYTTETSQNTYLFEGLYSDVAEEITGNWGAEPSSTNGGTYIMHKQ